MNNAESNVWSDATASQLAEVLSALSSPVEMKAFLRDVMTEKEIVEISARLKAARMLRSGKKYTDIVADTKLSSRTIARISDWLQNGDGGYDTALQLLEKHHAHPLPARAE